MLFTHRSMFDEPTLKSARRSFKNIDRGIKRISFKKIEGGTKRRLVATQVFITTASSGGKPNPTRNSLREERHNDDTFEECALSLTGAIVTLITSVVLVAFNTEFATASIQGILRS